MGDGKNGNGETITFAPWIIDSTSAILSVSGRSFEDWEFMNQIEEPSYQFEDPKRYEDEIGDITYPKGDDGPGLWDNDPDPRTKSFSQAYSRLTYNLASIDTELDTERQAVSQSLDLMSKIYEAAEDQSQRDVFNVKLPPKL